MTPRQLFKRFARFKPWEMTITPKCSRWARTHTTDKGRYASIQKWNDPTANLYFDVKLYPDSSHQGPVLDAFNELEYLKRFLDSMIFEDGHIAEKTILKWEDE